MIYLFFYVTKLDELDSVAIQLPYMGNRTVMDIILPNNR